MYNFHRINLPLQAHSSSAVTTLQRYACTIMLLTACGSLFLTPQASVALPLKANPGSAFLLPQAVSEQSRETTSQGAISNPALESLHSAVRSSVVKVPKLTGTAQLSGAALRSSVLQFPAGFMRSIKTYGAVGDGVTDDTAAIQAALSDQRTNPAGDYSGLPKALYFPAGVYLVSKTLSWNGCCVTLQGAGPTFSVIRLAPSSAGYNDATHPKAVLFTPAGISEFRQNIWDIGFSVGSGNPGAIGVDYVSNNYGSMHDVSVVSEDGQGYTGIAMTRFYAGPLMLKDVYIRGFQTGITTAAFEFGITIEGLTVEGQSVAGIFDHQQTITLRNFSSNNTVPAVVNDGFTILIDATLAGGLTGPAIKSTGNLYLRNISSSGYTSTLLDASVSPSVTLQGVVSEYLKGVTTTLLSTPTPHSLNLPVAETPSYIDEDLSKWKPFIPTMYGDTKYLQALFNQGSSTIYFPAGAYLAYNEVVITVPDTVNRIVGFSSVINRNTAGVNGGGIRFVVDSDRTQPLIVEQFAYGIKVEHHGTRPIVLKDGKYEYTSFDGAGQLFLEDVELPYVEFKAGQSIWARQLNDEAIGSKIVNAGQLWIFGLKTEQPGTVITTTAGGSTELLGNLLYPSRVLPTDSLALQSTDAKVSYIYAQSVYCTNCGYATQVSETRNGKTSKLTWSQSTRFVMRLFVGY